MKQRIITIFAIIVLIIGLSLLLYPTISNYFNTVNQRRMISDYITAVETLDDEEYQQLIDAAHEYNERLARSPDELFNLSDKQREEYYSLLDITGTGIMGYIDIEKADIYLPIYHGTSDEVLQVGAGHIEGSSLPVGGESSHSMLSGHRGLPSAMLFTNLDKLRPGDMFTIHVLSEEYLYKVISIDVVLPEELSSLSIDKGHDYCTLITCTPYGINTHRLLVKGERVVIADDEEAPTVLAKSSARPLSAMQVIAVVEIPVLIISLIVSLAVHKRSKTPRSRTSRSKRRG